METCACCQHPVEKLVLHHWFQPPEYKVQVAYVCDPCNRLLIPTRLWPRDSFITNDWDTDVQIELNHVSLNFSYSNFSRWMDTTVIGTIIVFVGCTFFHWSLCLSQIGISFGIVRGILLCHCVLVMMLHNLSSQYGN